LGSTIFHPGGEKWLDLFAHGVICRLQAEHYPQSVQSRHKSALPQQETITHQVCGDCVCVYLLQVEHYPLSVQSGRGLDLNVSLFERLVTQGFPYATLKVQHRMHPGISSLIKGTYPGKQHPSSAVLLLNWIFFQQQKFIYCALQNCDSQIIN
jgi:hypothetical protein